MKPSELLALAWSYHAGQPNQCDDYHPSKYHFSRHFLCNIVEDYGRYGLASIAEVEIVKEAIKRSLRYHDEYYRASYMGFYMASNRIYFKLDKHDPVYLEAKGKWVQELIDQLKIEESDGGAE